MLARHVPDASMTLLNEVMQRPLDPGYAAAATARLAQGASAPPRWRRAPLTIALSLLAGLLLVTGVMQLRLPRSLDTSQTLREQVTERSGEVAEREQRIEAVGADIAVLQDAQLRGADAQLLETASTLGLLAGTGAATGSGVVFTLDDSLASSDPLAGDPRIDEGIAQGRVLDVDLQQVTNGLWAAGVEAMAVNGHRLTSTSAIRSAGDAILVDLRPMAPPYVIEAIGDPQRAQADFARSEAGRYLASLEQNHGIQVSIEEADRLSLGSAGSLGLRYAVPLGGPGTDAGPPASPAASTPTEGNP